MSGLSTEKKTTAETIYGKRGLLVRLLYLLTALLFFCISKTINKKCSKILILCYHGVKEYQKNKFSRQMQRIKDRTVSITDLSKKSAKEHRQKLLLCVTFDDAYKNLLTNAIPVTSALQIPVTIFIATGSLGRFPAWLQGSSHPDSTEMVMTAEQLLELKENPLITFGSHTVNHPRLSQLQEEKMREELSVSRNAIQKLFYKPINDLALPYGDYNDRVTRVATEEGYERIYTLEPLVYPSEINATPHLIGRFSMSPDVWPIEFFLTVNGAYSWLYKWRTFVNNIGKLAHRR